MFHLLMPLQATTKNSVRTFLSSRKKFIQAFVYCYALLHFKSHLQLLLNFNFAVCKTNQGMNLA